MSKIVTSAILTALIVLNFTSQCDAQAITSLEGKWQRDASQVNFEAEFGMKVDRSPNCPAPYDREVQVRSDRLKKDPKHGSTAGWCGTMTWTGGFGHFELRAQHDGIYFFCEVSSC
jgi:hypothetical protein